MVRASTKAFPWALIVSMLLLCCLGSCGDTLPRTQIVVVVDTDYEVPEELHRIDITVTGPDGEEQTAASELRGNMDIPATLSLVHETGALGPYLIEVRANVAQPNRPDLTFCRLARVTFLEDRSLELPMHLLRQCWSSPCGDDVTQTCTEDGESVDIDIYPSELEEWDGTPQRLAANTDGDADGDVDGDVEAAGNGDADADGCIPSPEECNGIDDNCDGNIDEGFDRATDPDHCGECNHACDFANGTGECRLGECTVLSCTDGFGNCNDNDDDGCEADFASDDRNCGGCGTRCLGGTHCCPDVGCTRDPC